MSGLNSLVGASRASMNNYSRKLRFRVAHKCIQMLDTCLTNLNITCFFVKAQCFLPAHTIYKSGYGRLFNPHDFCNSIFG